MNKKMREIYEKMQAKLKEIETLSVDEKNAGTVATLFDELDALQKSYDTEAKLYDAQKKFAGLAGGVEVPAPTSEKSGLTGFGVISKMVRGQRLEEDEMKFITPQNEVQKALITGADAVNGENFLVPEDVRTAIIELRRTYISLKDSGVVTVIPTQSLAGSFNFESGTPSGLTNFSDGGAVSTGADPTFVQKPFSIALYGMIIPISNVLTMTEKSGLMAYLNKWFVKNAVLTENAQIIAKLKVGKPAKALSGWETLKASINKDLDPSCKIGGVIVTNQSGFVYLDSEKDLTGKPILQPNPANSTQKIFQDMAVLVLPDAQLPDVSSKHPFFYGRTSDGCWFIDLLGYLFASSEHAGFSKNQTHMRMIEGFDTVQADKDAYCYGLLTEPEPAAG
ncbi:MAG: phage major capsid protein [Firmicutes bacterium HGW-Firmicutes-16]|nr:MAG: phage major capsid protein [Firmicutes bacterium HGW-Firmicutes-16]